LAPQSPLAKKNAAAEKKTTPPTHPS